MDLTDQQFGRLTVIAEAERRGSLRYWRCRCVCGNEIETSGGNLRSGGSTSCGCLTRERTSETAHKHGRTGTVEHVVWVGMRQRCANPKNSRYADYGGRGITVCERWQSFENFYADMGPRPSDQHSVERIDNSKGYEPSNCRWANRVEQAQNRGNNRLIDFKGETLPIIEWSRRLGISSQLLGKRIDDLGWDVERALTTPVRQHRLRS